MAREALSPHLRKSGIPFPLTLVEVRQNQRVASFAELDRRVRSGAGLSAVFFGASLTWGTNANDPQKSSYRALMGSYLRDRYPHSRVSCHDAAIGGTGSKLGIFRLERDVFKYHPDVVFLDFTANDGIDSADPAGLASYERILRELISRGICVVQMFFAFAPNFGPGKNPAELARYRAHQRLARTYSTAVGDTIGAVQSAILSGQSRIQEIWPFDATHPGNLGYQLYFDAARESLESAVRDERVCLLPPETLYPARFSRRTRTAAVDLPAHAGWRREKAYRTSVFFDGLSSRWIDDVLAFSAHAESRVPLRVEFEGSMVGIMGEADQDGLDARIIIDGHELLPRNVRHPDPRVWPLNMQRVGGRLFFGESSRINSPPASMFSRFIPLCRTVPRGNSASKVSARPASKRPRIRCSNSRIS